jgi:plasmid stability protein
MRLKRKLRLRVAQHNRSMEDEARDILRHPWRRSRRGRETSPMRFADAWSPWAA